MGLAGRYRGVLPLLGSRRRRLRESCVYRGGCGQHLQTLWPAVALDAAGTWKGVALENAAPDIDGVRREREQKELD